MLYDKVLHFSPLQILNSLVNSMKTIKEKSVESSTDLQDEKTHRLKKSIEQIELGLGEAQVRSITNSLRNVCIIEYRYRLYNW